MLSVSIDDKKVQATLGGYRRYIGATGGLMQRISRDLRDYVRETMTMQGRKRPWAPLSRMTMLRTGRRKPLSTLVKQVRSDHTPQTARVFFVNPKGEGWTIEQHHKGFSIPPRVGRQGFYAARSRQPVFFMNAKGAKVPAREIIPTRREIDQVVGRAVKDWLSKVK